MLFVHVALLQLLVLTAVVTEEKFEDDSFPTETNEHDAINFSKGYTTRDKDWWKKSIVYQIYPRSFKDSDGDGVGDLQGIINSLDYFGYLNVDAIWLSPIYKSPMVDHGYDVEDYLDIDPTFGTMADFDELIREAHKRGIYVIMDLIPNHTSDKHRWFVESRKGDVDNPFNDYYVWHDGKLLPNGTRVPPNNWESVFSGSVWTWDDTRGQYYLHQFCIEQPDLNYRNKQVRREMNNVFTFWLEKGVDGFRVDAIGTLYEHQDMLDEPVIAKVSASAEDDQNTENNIYTRNQPEIHDAVREWRETIDKHDKKTGAHTLMVMEIYDPLMTEAMKYYHSGSDMPFNFNLIFATKTCGGLCFKELIDRWMNNMPAGKWPNFVIGNHDNVRISTRKGIEFVDAMNVLLLTLPGTPTTYYGEELGMKDIELSYEDTQDPWARNLGPELYRLKSRDPCRSPMQWDSTLNAGFSTADKTWLPLHPEYNTTNVEIQSSITNSPLDIYRQVAALRKETIFYNSQDFEYVVVSDEIISYVRYNRDPGSMPYLIAINVGSMQSTDDYFLQLNGEWYTAGNLLVVVGSLDNIEVGQGIPLENITLKPGQAIIVALVKTTKEEL